MENFSRSELYWIQACVCGEMERLQDYLENSDGAPILPALVKLRMEGLSVVNEKLGRIISEGHRRISVS